MNKFRKQLYNYIEENIEKGYSKESLEESLLKKGYDKNVLNEIFMEIDLEQSRKENKGFGLFKKKIRFELESDAKPIYQESIITQTSDKKGLNERVDEINNKIDMLTKVNIDKKHKNFELPSKITRKLKKLAEKNKVLVILLKTNKDVQPIITDIKDGFISINGVPHNCSMDFVFLWKHKFPCIILPEWDLNPIGTEDYYKAVKDKRVADPVAIVMRMIKNKEDLMGKPKFEFSAKWIVIIVIVIIAAGYIFLGGGK